MIIALLSFRSLRLDGLLVIVGVMAFASDLKAAVVAQDNASDVAYADGWQEGDNGGTGFMPWIGPGSYGPEPVMEIDTSPAETDNDLGAPAFRIGTGGIFGGYQIERPFANPMQAGDSFSLDYDSYPITGAGAPRDILIRFGSQDGERLAFYAWYYNDGASQFGNDFWGVNGLTANDNLAGGASLPPGPVSGIRFQSTYSTTDGSDGFHLTLDLPTIDSYRLRIVDDGVTKLDVSGELKTQTSGGTSLLGQPINTVRFYGSETSFQFPETGGVAYFNNLLIESADGLPGDFDADGDVDGRDFLVWQRNPAIGSLSDWQSNYGSPLVSAITSVPEPTTAGLMILALVGLLGRQRK